MPWGYISEGRKEKSPNQNQLKKKNWIELFSGVNLQDDSVSLSKGGTGLEPRMAGLAHPQLAPIVRYFLASVVENSRRINNRALPSMLACA